MKSLASILVTHLKKWEIEYVFGIPGKPLVPLIMELKEQNVQFILTRHESGAGYAATGYALMNRKLGVVIGTAGPGGTNLLTAAAQAKSSHAPVLFITGHPPISSSGKALGQDSTFLGTNLVRMFEYVTKFSAKVERADLFYQYLKHALEKACSGVKGPVHLSIPSDVFNEQTYEFELNLPINMSRLISTDMDEFITKLDNAKRPVILSGKGVHSSFAYEELKEVAEAWNIPVMTTPGGKGTFIENHPLSLGAFGLGGTEISSEYIEKGIDLLVIVGSKLSDMSLVGLPSQFYPKEVIHMDYEQTFIAKSLLVPTLPIIGDIKENLKSVLIKIKDRNRKEYFLFDDNQDDDNQDDNQDDNHHRSSYISAINVMRIIRQETPDDLIVFGDDGSHSYYAIKYFNIRKPGTFFFDDVFGAMGHAIGYSIGAKLADNNLNIICLTGDGCTLMHGTEISTAVNYNIPVIFIVLNNGRLDMVDKGMRYNLGKAVGTVYNIPLNIKEFAESMGANSFKCYDEIELRGALKTSQEYGKPVVIEVMVDPHEIPPTLKRG